MGERKESFVAVVVNDDPTQLAILAGLLRTAGVAARAFESADAALAAMDPADPPGLVVTDLYMPGIDGWRFCRLLRSPDYPAFNEVPILVVSATFAGEHAERIAAEVGADAFLPSPVVGKAFSARALALLSGKEARRPPRALIVEDSKTLAELVRKTFDAHGYRTDVAPTAKAAANAFARAAYDVAVLDYHLPDGSGAELLDAFRAGRPDCVCVMITGDPMPELALSFMKRGAAALLRKPFEAEYLIEQCARARRERALLRTEDLLEARTRQLRESEAKYRAWFSQSTDAIYLHDLEGRILDVNEMACAQSGYSREEWLGLTVFDGHPSESATNPPQDEILRVWRRLAPEERLLVEAEHQRKDGTVYPVEISTGIIRFDDKPVLLAIVRDVTRRKRAEAERETLQAQLIQAQKMESVGRLAGGVAHDFNNMLGVILGRAELAMARLGPDEPLRHELDEIDKAARRSADITRQLLAFARRQAIAPRVLDLNTVVEDMLKLLRRLIGEDIDLVWKPGRELWPVEVDPAHLDQILANLCVNARDAIEGVGRIVIGTDNVVFDARSQGVGPGDFVRLTVSDDGCGMGAETVDRAFEPFFTTKAPGKGTGLGLSTVYGAARQNRGTVNLRSEPGRGTTVELYLPRADGEARKPEAGEPEAARGDETILLVEDDPAVLMVAAKMLESLGYAVVAAHTPEEALRLAEEHRIDLLMTDMVMPEMSGRDLARHLLSRHPDMARLFMSGYAADFIAPGAMSGEGAHFIQKPFSIRVLAAKVREALGSRGAEERHTRV